MIWNTVTYKTKLVTLKYGSSQEVTVKITRWYFLLIPILFKEEAV